MNLLRRLRFRWPWYLEPDYRWVRRSWWLSADSTARPWPHVYYDSHPNIDVDNN